MAMHGGDIEGVLAIVALFVLPSIALSVRFTARTVADAILRLRTGSVPPPPQQDDPRVATLEEEVHELRNRLARLTETVEFDAQLRAAGGGPARLPGTHR